MREQARNMVDFRPDADFVIHALAKYRQHDDIITELCERSGYEWGEAADFVRRVESEHGDEIERLRRLLHRAMLGLFSLVLLAVGVGLLFYIGLPRAIASLNWPATAGVVVCSE